MSARVFVIGVTILFVLFMFGMFTLSQYITAVVDLFEWAIVSAVRSYVFWIIAGSFIAALIGILRLFGFRG